jgi:AmiR/NasT family two-component response regulator
MLRLLLQTPLDPLATGTHLALHRTEVHQATGILTVQLGIPLGPALALLRAYSYSHNRSLLSVARDIIAHRIRLFPP